eukprot:1161603-Pelagomonas_calceolata.AAC.21
MGIWGLEMCTLDCYAIEVLGLCGLPPLHEDVSSQSLKESGGSLDHMSLPVACNFFPLLKTIIFMGWSRLSTIVLRLTEVLENTSRTCVCAFVCMCACVRVHVLLAAAQLPLKTCLGIILAPKTSSTLPLLFLQGPASPHEQGNPTQGTESGTSSVKSKYLHSLSGTQSSHEQRSPTQGTASGASSVKSKNLHNEPACALRPGSGSLNFVANVPP